MLDWKSIKEKAQKITADVSAIADEISASAKDFVADAKVKADEPLVEVKSAAKNISDKAVEMWDSEDEDSYYENFIEDINYLEKKYDHFICFRFYRITFFSVFFKRNIFYSNKTLFYCVFCIFSIFTFSLTIHSWSTFYMFLIS